MGSFYNLRGYYNDLMTMITGQSGRLNLKDSNVEFRNWTIYVPNTSGLKEWMGDFEIQKSDYLMRVMNSVDELNAEFYGDENYNGKIIIGYSEVSSDDGPVISIDFSGASGLKKL